VIYHLSKSAHLTAIISEVNLVRRIPDFLRKQLYTLTNRLQLKPQIIEHSGEQYETIPITKRKNMLVHHQVTVYVPQVAKSHCASFHHH